MWLQWRFTGLGSGWAISSALKPIGEGYAIPLLGSQSSTGYDLMAASFPVAWEVKGADHPGPKGEGTAEIYQQVQFFVKSCDSLNSCLLQNLLASIQLRT